MSKKVPKIPLKTLGHREHNREKWIIEFHEDFDQEFQLVSVAIRRGVYSLIEMLQRFGPQLGRPQVDTLNGSKHKNMKELRFQSENGVWRIAFAFDQKRKAILLVGGDKVGISKERFYRNLIQIADRHFDQHLAAIAKEEKS